MPLTLAQKSDCRRHLGYSHIGLDRSAAAGPLLGVNAGIRFTKEWGNLEQQLNMLEPTDEAKLTGAVVGTVAVMGVPSPLDNGLLQVTVTPLPGGAPISSGVDIPPNTDLVQAAAMLAAACAQNTQLLAVPVLPLFPYGPNSLRYGDIAALPEVVFSSPNMFSLQTVSGTTIALVVLQAPEYPNPAMTIGEGSDQSTVYGYLNILNLLEGDTAASRQNLDTSQIGDMKLRYFETRQREELYQLWRQKLSNFLGVPLNPLAPAKRGGNRLRNG